MHRYTQARHRSRRFIIIAAAAQDSSLHVMLSDVERAYFHAAASHELYVHIPMEDPDWSPDAIGRLNLALYGTRDAAKLWQECAANHVTSIGFARGSPTHASISTLSAT